MRFGVFVLSLLVLVPAPPATAGQPSVRYEVAVESPGGVATGTLPVRVRVSGGVREAREAAFHVRRSGGWSEDQRVPLTRVSDSLFEATWDTTGWENAAYRLEVRVWGDVPPYDPSDPRTFARATADVAVDNVPPSPERIQALSPASAIRVGWTAVPTADRSDFDGYRVVAAKGSTCPADRGAYRVLAEVDQPLYVDPRPDPGWYCVRTVALRFSVLTGTVESSLSPQVRIHVDRGAGGGIGIVTGEPPVPPVPPPPPAPGEGTVEVSDGAFEEDLPYDPRTVTELIEGDSEPAAVGEREAGADPRRTPTLVAFGMVLAVGALLIRRFLGAGALPR